MTDERDDAHTPTPWFKASENEICGPKEHGFPVIGWTTGSMQQNRAANARLIVRAVNENAALQACAEALRAMRAQADQWTPGHAKDCECPWCAAEAALAALAEAEARGDG